MVIALVEFDGTLEDLRTVPWVKTASALHDTRHGSFYAWVKNFQDNPILWAEAKRIMEHSAPAIASFAAFPLPKTASISARILGGNEWCDAPDCPRAYAFVGEDRGGYRWAVCENHRRGGPRWAWLKTRDGQFPADPNAEVLTYPEASK